MPYSNMGYNAGEKINYFVRTKKKGVSEKHRPLDRFASGFRKKIAACFFDARFARPAL